MKKVEKRTSRKLNITHLLASVVVVLITMLAILLGINHLNKEEAATNSNNGQIVQQSKDKVKKSNKVNKVEKPKLIDSTTLQKTLDDAVNIDRTYYTDESLDLLDQAVANAQSVIQNNGSQQEINDVNLELVRAMVSLEKK
ncbi:MAG: hypothetical protein Q4A76_07605 [Porphyromonadaceae bacterium]|nr:hypothetical protein [Porphyromonadaceae bacterium]